MTDLRRCRNDIYCTYLSTDATIKERHETWG